MRETLAATFGILVVLGRPGLVVGQETRWQLGAALNNPGLQQTVELVWSKPLTTSTHPLRDGAHLSGAAVSVTTPAQARLGGWLEYAPLSILAVRAGVEPGGYFGTFHSVMSFTSYTDDFSRDTRNLRGDGQAGFGLRAYVSPALQGRLGPFVARVTGDLEHWRSSASGPYFYEPTRDTLLRSRGDWLVNTTAVALYERRGPRKSVTSVGVLHALTRVSHAPGNRTQRVGGIGVHEWSGRRLGVPHPRVTATVWRYAEDPYKSGQWGGAVAIAFRTGR